MLWGAFAMASWAGGNWIIRRGVGSAVLDGASRRKRYLVLRGIAFLMQLNCPEGRLLGRFDVFVDRNHRRRPDLKAARIARAVKVDLYVAPNFVSVN